MKIHEKMMVFYFNGNEIGSGGVGYGFCEKGFSATWGSVEENSGGGIDGEFGESFGACDG